MQTAVQQRGRNVLPCLFRKSICQLAGVYKIGLQGAEPQPSIVHLLLCIIPPSITAGGCWWLSSWTYLSAKKENFVEEINNSDGCSCCLSQGVSMAYGMQLFIIKGQVSLSTQLVSALHYIFRVTISSFFFCFLRTNFWKKLLSRRGS